MNWKRFNLVNNILGWVAMLIATVVYLMTMEPTASLWDCAEFVACDYRLEVGHPPGAPFYMLVYNVITHLAPDAGQVGLYANATSALISGLCIMFLYWTLTHMLRRLIEPKFRRPSGSARLEARPLTLGQSIIILGGAMAGALVYTFSDTFWFSAVEAEVYAFSSLFTAVVFWLMFQWDERSDSASADRWLILIAYLMGLSIGVHLLNLLCLPAMALIYYYRRSELPTPKGAIGSVLVSFGLIVVMMYGIVQGVPKMAGRFDYLFVNHLGTSFNTGLYVYLALVLAVLAWSVVEAHHALRSQSGVGLGLKTSMLSSVLLLGIPFLGDGYLLGIALSIALAIGLYYWGSKLSVRFVHVLQMSLLAIAIGFSSYGVILVRAIANPPMNENAPDNAFSLRYYLAREQYGSAPLFYGPTFASRITKVADGKEVLGKAPKATPDAPDSYVKRQDQPVYEYAPGSMMLFPRVYSRQHAQAYNGWMGRSANDMTPPSFAENLKYFFNYQINYMYWRYFAWNFVGRQNDLMGQGELLKGNAITGIPMIDYFIEGSSEALPESLRSNKARNVYYALPLLLGLLGIFYQATRVRRDDSIAKRGKVGISLGAQSFWITFLLFFMTGLAIVLYLNQTPGQPRERDYAYAGSFYAYAIWIGIGVAGLWRVLVRTKLGESASALVAVAVGLAIPLQMASQNWDDHDRSGRTIARDIGINYLESLEPNAILFCYGDNDTFPLWYIQDVEGVRTDVRTVNLSYLSGDWYIDQMRRKTYEGEPLPMRYMTPEFYYYHELLYIDKGADMSVQQALSALPAQASQREAVLPSGSLSLAVDTAQVNAMVASDSSLHGRALASLPIKLSRHAIDRGTATMLDIIAENQWRRPIYWTSTSPRDAFDGLPKYQLLTGMAYQLLPLDLGEQTDSEGNVRAAHSKVRIEEMYDNVMNKFRYGGADNPNVYFDETARNMMLGLRSEIFPALANALLDTGDRERAQAVLLRCLSAIHPKVVPHGYFSMRLVQALYRAGLTDQADEIAVSIAQASLERLDWMMTTHDGALRRLMMEGTLGQEFETALLAYQIAEQSGSKAVAIYEDKLIAYHKLFNSRKQ